MDALNIAYHPITQLTAAKRNARKHSRKQIGQIADSIRTFGWTNPILVDDRNVIVAGHGRLEAAKLLDLTEVPVVRLSHLSPEEVRAYAIADNRLAELAGWDRELLSLELGELMELELSFDIEIAGFEMGEIDLLLGTDVPTGQPPEPPLPDAPAAPVTRPGDVWLLGDHRLICGDALDPATYDRLMAGGKADLVICDPPYNVRISGHVSGLGKVQHREFAMASGEMSETQFIAFLTRAFRLLAEHSRDGSLSFQYMDWSHAYEILTAGREVYRELKNICVWNKDNGGMGSLYRSKHELVFVFKNGIGPHVNNIELGRFGRYRTNVWDYAGVNTLKPGRMDELAMHPTVKPVALIADAILDVTARGEIVLDMFGGSGSTLIAAEKTGRTARLIGVLPAPPTVKLPMQMTGAGAWREIIVRWRCEATAA